jgi:biotin transport system substrate-specific component
MIYSLSQNLRHTALSNTLSFCQVVIASLLIAICAQVKIPLYFTPVALSLQTLAVMLIGASLGSRLGALSVIAYLLEGCMGMPVFIGGTSGFFYLLGPTGGYLVGFVLQAYFVGWLTEKFKFTSAPKTVALLLLSCALQLGLGSLWLSNFVGFQYSIAMGVTPFIIGEIFKSLALAFYLQRQRA